VEPTLQNVAVRRARWPGAPRRNPDRLIADRAYDSNPLRESLDQQELNRSSRLVRHTRERATKMVASSAGTDIVGALLTLWYSYQLNDMQGAPDPSRVMKMSWYSSLLKLKTAALSGCPLI